MTSIKIVYGYLIDTQKFDQFLIKRNFMNHKLVFLQENGYENIQNIIETNIEVPYPVCVFTNYRQNKILQDYIPFDRFYLGVSLLNFELFETNRYEDVEKLKFLSRYRDAIHKILLHNSELSQIITHEPGIFCVYNKNL